VNSLAHSDQEALLISNNIIFFGIEEIEDQMDDWLENKKTQKKVVLFCVC